MSRLNARIPWFFFLIFGTSAVLFQNCSAMKPAALSETPSAQCKARTSATVDPNGNGNITIFPNFENGFPADVVGLRFKTRVVTNQSPTIKIIFSSHRFWNPADASRTYLLESNLYSNTYTYADNQCTTFPPLGTHTQQSSAIWMSVPDYNLMGKIGAKTDSAMFPRQTILIDNIPNLKKLETISQTDITGREVAVEYSRGGIIADKTGWKTCNDDLDGDDYRQWDSKVTIAPPLGQTQPSVSTVSFALPESHAQFIYPTEIMSIYTEFFADPGLFKAYYWDVEYLTLGETVWVPINRWELRQNNGPATANGYGVRITKDGARDVIEFSNEGPDNYVSQLGSVMVFSGPPATPAPAPEAGTDPCAP